MKSTIIDIGIIDQNNQPQFWTFDGHGEVPTIEITEDDVLYGGYSVDELREIAEREGTQ